MAKEIKAIQCPKCGSTQKVETRQDYFKCLSCDTEYYLDNDDITITHNVNYATPSTPPSAKKALKVVVAVFLFLMVTLFIITRIFNSSAPVQANEEKEEYHWWDNDAVAYVGTDGKPIVAVMGQRDFMGSEHETKSGKYIVFYDLLSEKEIKSQRLENIPKAGSENVYFRAFENGDIYAIANKTIIFKINKGNMVLNDVTRSAFAHHPELSTGIANAEFIGAEYGDGFNLMTNDGKSYFYFPVIDRVYTKDAYEQAKDDLEIRDDHAKKKTYYDFSSVSSSYPDEKTQLIKFTQKDNAGGPNARAYFEVDYHTADNGQRQKTIFRWGEDLVLSYSDLTPGRLYFSPKVLYSDAKYVLLSSNATAAQESNTSLQCLNPDTGAILFTLPFSESKSFYDVIRYKEGFLIKTSGSIIAVSTDGKLLKEFKTR